MSWRGCTAVAVLLRCNALAVLLVYSPVRNSNSHSNWCQLNGIKEPCTTMCNLFPTHSAITRFTSELRLRVSDRHLPAGHGPFESPFPVWTAPVACYSVRGPAPRLQSDVAGVRLTILTIHSSRAWNIRPGWVVQHPHAPPAGPVPAASTAP